MMPYFTTHYSEKSRTTKRSWSAKISKHYLQRFTRIHWSTWKSRAWKYQRDMKTVEQSVPFDVLPNLSTKSPRSSRFAHYLRLPVACISLTFNIQPVVPPLKKAITTPQPKTSSCLVIPNKKDLWDTEIRLRKGHKISDGWREKGPNIYNART